MNKATLQKACRGFMKKASKHSPAILAGIGVVSIVSTAIFAVKATPKATQVLDEGKDDIERIKEDDDFTEDEKKLEIREIRKQMCIEFAKLYWKAAANAALGTTAIIFAYRTQNKRNLALSAAYALAAQELTDWKETARELKILNKGNEQKIRDKMTEKKVERAKDSNKQVIFTGTGEDLFIDDWSGQVFKSSVVEVEKAVNEWNSQMLMYDQVTLNDLYYLLKIPEVPAGDLGFESGHGTVGVIFGSSLVGDKAYITMGFDRQPTIL